MVLREVLEEVRSYIADGHASGATEQEAKDWFIAPVLRALGWRGPGRVRLEYPAGRERVKMDFALQGPNRKSVALIEAKAPSADLAAHVGQVMQYAFFEGVGICVLTTGVDWWLYLPFEKGDPAARRFAELDVRDGDLDELVKALESWLDYEAVTSGEAEKRAKAVLEARQNEERLLAEMPSAWQRLLQGPEDLLVELVQDEVKKEIGLAPNRQQVAEFLREAAGRPARPRPPVPHPPPPTPPGPKPPNPRPSGYRLWGKNHQVEQQWEILAGVATALHKRHSDSFERVLGVSARFTTTPTALRSPVRIGRSKYYHEKHLNQDHLTRTVQKLLQAFGYRTDEFAILHDAPAESRTPPASDPGSHHSEGGRSRVSGFVLWGKPHEANRWSDVWIQVAELVYQRHSHEFERALQLRGQSRRYISFASDDHLRARRIGDSPYYAETNFSRTDCIRRIHGLLRLFEYGDDVFEVQER